MRRKTAFFFALLVLVFVWISLFNRRIPIPIQSALFFLILLLEIFLIGAGWWYYVRSRKAAGIATWRKRTALAAVLANTAAFAIPLGSLLYMIFYPSIGLRMGLPMIDGEKMIFGCLALCLFGVAAGSLSPTQTRLATVLGSLIIALLLLAIPVPVL